MTTRWTRASLAGFMALFMGLSISQTTWADNSEKASKTLTKLSEDVADWGKTLGVALKSLDDMVNNPGTDLRKQYKAYESAVSKLESAAKGSDKRNAAFAKEREAYLMEWDKQIAQIQSEDIRTLSTKRREAFQSGMAKLKASYAEANTTYKSLFSNLTDIKKFLATDLTKGGVASISDLANKARTNATTLRQNIQTLAAEIRSAGTALSPLQPEKKK